MAKRLSSKLIFYGSFLLLVCMTYQDLKAGECVRVARDCIEPGETRNINGHNIHRECWRYKDAYRCGGYAKNDCTEFDDESFCHLEDSSCDKKIGDWCVAQRRKYDCEEEEKYMRKEKRFKAPTFKRENIDERKKVVCGEEIKCIDGKCFDISYSANDEISEAGGMLAALKNMQGNWQKNLSIFKGGDEHCDKKATGYTNCCSKMSGWGKNFGAKCGEGAKILATKREEGKCHEVGPYCASKKLGICIIQRTVHCCFDSKIAKEINEQSRAKGLIQKNWGSPEAPNCSGFSLEELQNLDFTKIDFSFLVEDLNKQSLWGKMGDMKKAMEHVENLMKGEINAIKEDMVNEGQKKSRSDDISDNIDEQKLYEQKFNEAHEDASTQKKPYGRDKTKDEHKGAETQYNQEEYKNRDYKGL